MGGFAQKTVLRCALYNLSRSRAGDCRVPLVGVMAGVTEYFSRLVPVKIIGKKREIGAKILTQFQDTDINRMGIVPYLFMFGHQAFGVAAVADF